MNASGLVRRAYADVDGLQLHYRFCGEPECPTLLLLHQTPSSSAMYESLMTQLAGEFFVLAPDTPGFGNSDPLPGVFTIAGVAQLMEGLLRTLDRQGSFVFGHHTGAAIAVQLAFDVPARVVAMALSGPTLLTEEQKRSLPDAASPFPLDPQGKHLQAMWQRLRTKDSKADLALSQRELFSAFASGDAYQASYRAVCAQDFAVQLESINCPALVFAGDADPLRAAVAPTIEKLAQGRVLDLPPGAGTYICEQQVDLLAAELNTFFRPGSERQYDGS